MGFDIAKRTNIANGAAGPPKFNRTKERKKERENGRTRVGKSCTQCLALVYDEWLSYLLYLCLNT